MFSPYTIALQLTLLHNGTPYPIVVSMSMTPWPSAFSIQSQ